MSLEPISSTIPHLTAGRPTVATSSALALTTATENNCNCDCHSSIDEVDKLLNLFPDLTNPTFKAWYCKAIYRLGCQQFTELADQARKGNQPPKLFSSLLKGRLDGRMK